MENFSTRRTSVFRVAAAALAVCLAAFRCAAYSELPVERCMLFNAWTNGVDYGGYYSSDWTHEGGAPDEAGLVGNRLKAQRKPLLDGTNHVHSSGWTVWRGRTGSSSSITNAKKIEPSNYENTFFTTNWQCNLGTCTDAYLGSPYYTNGIGTIYFDAVNVLDASSVAVEIATNMENRLTHESHSMEPAETAGYAYRWVAVSNLALDVAADGVWERYRQTLNYFGAIRFRVRRTSAPESPVNTDSPPVAIDNVCVSYPRVGVTVGNASLSRTPGVLASARVRCVVSNEDFAPSLLPEQYSDYRSRTVTVLYKTDADADYTSAVLAYDGESGDGYGNGEVYTGEISFDEGAETLTYAFACQVTGNRYFPEDYTLSGKTFWDDGDGGEPPVSDATEPQTRNVADWSKSKGVSTLGADRLMLFNKWTNGVDYGDYDSSDWTHEGGEPWAVGARPKAERKHLLNGTNHVHTAGWEVVEGRTGTSSKITGANFIHPETYSEFAVEPNRQANLFNTLDAKIVSPFYTNGIGTIYFDAVNTDEAGTLVVQVATNMVDRNSSLYRKEIAPEEYEEEDAEIPGFTHSWVYDWQDVSTNTLDCPAGTVRGTEGFLRYRGTLNIRRPARFRIVRAEPLSTTTTVGAPIEEQLLAIDNIQVSVPPADVVIMRDLYDFDPGYPAVGQTLQVRCRVSNVDTNHTTTSADRNVKVVYRWRYLDQSVGAWQTNAMAYAGVTEGDDGEGNGELYLGEIPAQDRVGDLEYYFVCSFDGFRFIPTDYAQLGYDFWPENPDFRGEHSESPSPRALRGTDAGGDREFYARLRPYRSSIEKMLVKTDFLDEPVELQLIGDDVWRGYIPLADLGDGEDFTFYFMATNTYVATTNADGLILHEKNTVPRYWAEVAQSANGVSAMPTGGSCQELTEKSQMRVRVSGAGSAYAGVQIDLGTMEYQVCRAEYQNFNDWANYKNYFTWSYGQPEKTSVSENFDAWTLDEDSTQTEYFNFKPPDDTINAYRASFVTYTDWMAYNATYAQELVRASELNNAYGTSTTTESKRFANVSLRLIGGDAWNSAENENIEVTGAGAVTTLGRTLVDGLKSLDFKARVMTPVTADGLIQYIGPLMPKVDGVPKNYAMSADVIADNTTSASQSREEHSISLLAYIQDVGTFYEVRVTQCRCDTTKQDLPDANGNSTFARLALYRWTRGVPARLAQSDVLDGLGFGGQLALTIRVYTDVASTYVYGKVSNTSGATLTVECEDTDAALRLTEGNPGAMISNCQGKIGVGVNNPPRVSEYGGKGTEPTASISLPLDKAIVPYNWSYDATRYTIDGVITALVPSQTLSLYTQPATYTDSNREDPSENGWTLATNFTVSSYSYQSFLYEPKSAKALHVKLQNAGGADIAVDELVLRSWHGNTRSFSGPNDVSGEWRVAEAWVQEGTPATKGRVVELDMSRALETRSGADEEGARQYVRSPLLLNGRGQISFDYKVVRPPVQLTVQQRADSGSWTDVPFGSWTVSNATGWLHASVYVGNIENSGYLRILNDGRHGVTNGVVDIDSAIAWDEPAVSEAAWVVYNGVVTDTEPSRLPLDETKALFLNNDAKAGVMEGFDMHHQPYLKTPYLENGLGELRFEARLYDPNDTREGKIYVYGLTNDNWSAEDTWAPIDELAVTNVAKQFYTVYVRDPSRYDMLDNVTFHAVKLVTSTNGNLPRVCIENVSVQEPVYPGFDINDVRLLYHRNNDEYGYRDQPLTTDMIGIEARLTNIRLSPSNINVYVSYHVGTNTWGAANLWGRNVRNWSPAQSTTIKMVRDADDPQVYRTPFDDDIPFQEENAVVQYCVWAMYNDPNPDKREPYYQVQKEDSFTMPSWYYPMDFNSMYSGWSPYFIVYRIPHGCVFVNELNPYETRYEEPPEGAGRWVNPYLELAIPAETDLSRWRVDVLFGEDGDYDNLLTHTIRMSEAGKEEVTNGFAFYVVADASRNQHTPALTNVDAEINGFPDYFSSRPGAVRIRRPLGMYEHVVAFDHQNGRDAVSYAENDPDQPYGMVFVGSDTPLASLSVTNGCGETIDDWCTIAQLPDSTIDHLVAFDRNTIVWTPGQPNLCQVLPPIPEIFAGMSNVIVKAVLSGPGGGLQNGTSSRLNFKIARGVGSTNIVYNTPNWYRIVSLTANKTNDLLASSCFTQNSTTNYTLLVTNILEDTEIVAYVDRDPSIVRLGLPQPIRDWLFSYPDSLIVTNSWDIPDNRPLTFTELYWLNCDPTVYYELDGGFTGKVERTLGGSNVFLSVWLTLNGQNVKSLRGSQDIDRPAFKIKVKDDLLSPYDWLFARQYYFDENSFDSNHTCRLLIDTFPFEGGKCVYDYDRLFFKWVLEFDEAKSTPYWLLTNCPTANP